jgi:Sec-independent protein translocase protein TatA
MLNSRAKLTEAVATQAEEIEELRQALADLTARLDAMGEDEEEEAMEEDEEEASAEAVAMGEDEEDEVEDAYSLAASLEAAIARIDALEKAPRAIGRQPVAGANAPSSPAAKAPKDIYEKTAANLKALGIEPLRNV